MGYIKVVVKKEDDIVEKIISEDALYVLIWHKGLRDKSFDTIRQVLELLQVSRSDSSILPISWAPFDCGLIYIDLDHSKLISSQNITYLNKAYYHQLEKEVDNGFVSKPDELMFHRLPESLSKLAMFENLLEDGAVKGFEVALGVNTRVEHNVQISRQKSKYPTMADFVRDGRDVPDMTCFLVDLPFLYIDIDTADSQLIDRVSTVSGVSVLDMDNELFEAFHVKERYPDIKAEILANMVPTRVDPYSFGAMSL